MPDFVFVHQFNDEPETSGQVHLRNLDEAIAFGHLQLEHGLKEREDAVAEQSAAVSIGYVGLDDDIEWIGDWEWDEAAGFVWSSANEDRGTAEGTGAEPGGS